MNNRAKRPLPKKHLLVVLVLGVIIGSFFGVHWLHYYLTHASTDDASIKGDLIAISPTVQGKILDFPIQEGDQVKKGQLIAQLRKEDYQAEVDVAAGVVQSIEATLKEAGADLALVDDRPEGGRKAASRRTAGASSVSRLTLVCLHREHASTRQRPICV